jgi:mannosyl-3-phosphoglycerate phosphatase
MMFKPLIFTDLDGTLLDEVYRFDGALSALAYLRQNDIPVVICSSKTRSEIELYRKMLNNSHPFVSENGGGVFIPCGYFDGRLTIRASEGRAAVGYQVLRLGVRYADLRRVLRSLQREGHPVRGFGDMSLQEVAHLTGLPLEEARLAMHRDFDEPFVIEHNDKGLENLSESIHRKGLHVTKGRIHHLLGPNDKGKAVSMLIDLYRQRYEAVKTVGLGDSPNDLPMLRAVDMAVVVQKPDGTYDPILMGLPAAIRAEGAGPLGWNRAVRRLVPSLLSKGRVNKV